MSRIVSVTPAPVERESRTLKTAGSLARLGHESIVVEAGRSRLEANQRPFALVSLGAPEANGGAPAPPGYHTVPGRLRRIVERVLSVPLTIALFLRGALATARELPAADVYWLHGYHQFPAVWLAARRHGARVVYDAHDYYPDLVLGGERTALESWLMRGFYLLLERRAARSADAMVTASEGFADLYAPRRGERPAVVINCAETRNGTRPARTIRATLGLDESALLLVMAGHHKVVSALDGALEAMAQLPDHVHLAFVGRGYEAVERVSDRVHVHPAVPSAEVSAFIADADAAPILYADTLPYVRHSLPNGLFNAVAAGLPVLYPEPLPEIRRLAERYGLGLPIDPADPASIVAAVRSLLDDAALRERLRAQVARARDELSWANQERTIAAIVEAMS